MTEQIVVTMGDERFRKITDITFPRTRRYADRIGADFHVISERRYPNVNICYEKFQLKDLLTRYKRVLYVDGDVLVHSKAEDIFKLVPYGHFGAMDEAAHLEFWTPERVHEQFSPYGWTGPWGGRHFNAGVMVLDRTHGALFENPLITNRPYWDQPYFNVMVERLGLPFFSLPPRFNFMRFHAYRYPHNLDAEAQFIHFAGTTMSPDQKSVIIQAKAEVDSIL